MTLSALTKEGKIDICGQYNLPTIDLETESGGPQLGILVAAIIVPLVAILTVLVAILLLLVVVLRRKRSRWVWFGECLLHAIVISSIMILLGVLICL